MDPELFIPLALSGFHVAVTLIALYRARHALRVARTEGRGDRGTLWRLATLRFVAAVVILSGGLLAFCTPLLVASAWIVAVLPTTPMGLGMILGGAWLVWIPATIALDNLALRWLKARPERLQEGERQVLSLPVRSRKEQVQCAKRVDVLTSPLSPGRGGPDREPPRRAGSVSDRSP